MDEKEEEPTSHRRHGVANLGSDAAAGPGTVHEGTDANVGGPSFDMEMEEVVADVSAATIVASHPGNGNENNSMEEEAVTLRETDCLSEIGMETEENIVPSAERLAIHEEQTPASETEAEAEAEVEVEVEVEAVAQAEAVVEVEAEAEAVAEAVVEVEAEAVVEVEVEAVPEAEAEAVAIVHNSDGEYPRNVSPTGEVRTSGAEQEDDDGQDIMDELGIEDFDDIETVEINARGIAPRELVGIIDDSMENILRRREANVEALFNEVDSAIDEMSALLEVESSDSSNNHSTDEENDANSVALNPGSVIEEEINRIQEMHHRVSALRAMYPLSPHQLWRLRRVLFRVGNPNSGNSGGSRTQPIGESDNANRNEAAGGEMDDNQMLAADADDDEVAERLSISFDTNLPAEHSYLGDNMSRVSGVDYLEVGKEYNMLLFLHPHVIYPGDVLPFLIARNILNEGFDSRSGLLIGVCFKGLRSKTTDGLYGVTCQIYEKGVNVYGKTMIKSHAMQRFVTTKDTPIEQLEYLSDNPHLVYGNVKILPEIYLPEPLNCLNMGSMNRFRGIDSMEREYRRFQAATTVWPAHIFDLYNISPIVEMARKTLENHQLNTMPTDPVQLSFWLARNLPLSADKRNKIFMSDIVNLRMELINNSFIEEAIFMCRICGNRIAKCKELFAMSKQGIQSQYCNSAGCIHETNTVRKVTSEAITYSGQPSVDFSWFPGYSWRIIVCKVCVRHIGWEFRAVQDDLLPRTFFCLSSSSVGLSEALRGRVNPREGILRHFEY